MSKIWTWKSNRIPILYAATRPGLQYCSKFMCLHFKVKILQVQKHNRKHWSPWNMPWYNWRNSVYLSILREDRAVIWPKFASTSLWNIFLIEAVPIPGPERKSTVLRLEVEGTKNSASKRQKSWRVMKQEVNEEFQSSQPPKWWSNKKTRGTQPPHSSN